MLDLGPLYLQSGIDTEAPSSWIHTGNILGIVYFFQGEFLSVIPADSKKWKST